MSIIPFMFWGSTLVVGLLVYVIAASTIEKTGMPRLGATGNIFTCDPKEENK